MPDFLGDAAASSHWVLEAVGDENDKFGEAANLYRK